MLPIFEKKTSTFFNEGKKNSLVEINQYGLSEEGIVTLGKAVICVSVIDAAVVLGKILYKKIKERKKRKEMERDK